jgi:hypothetical protein
MFWLPNADTSTSYKSPFGWILERVHFEVDLFDWIHIELVVEEVAKPCNGTHNEWEAVNMSSFERKFALRYFQTRIGDDAFQSDNSKVEQLTLSLDT